MEKEARWKKGLNKVQAHDEEASTELKKILGALLALPAAAMGAAASAIGGDE